MLCIWPLYTECRVEKERRAAEAEAKARDVRLQRALEEVDRYKQMLQDVKMQVSKGVELRGGLRKEHRGQKRGLKGVA